MQERKEHGAKSKSCDCLLHRLALTLALAQRARGLEKTHLKIDIRYLSSKPIAFCLLSSSLVLEASVWITGPALFQCKDSEIAPRRTNTKIYSRQDAKNAK